ncbi:MAG: 6-phosphogluconolactonase [Alphaproteobacteria bacterium]
MGSTQTREPTGPSPTWHDAPDRDALAAIVAAHIVAALRAAVAARGSASLVVPGGNTPVPVFERLSTADLAWERVTVTLTDERFVDEADPHSNAALIRRHLLTDKAAAARFVSLKRPGSTPSETLGDVARDLAAVGRPFDVVMLGMGGDGHVASLFPRADGVEAALDPAGPDTVCAIVPDPLPDNAPFARISLTAGALFDARAVILMVTGADKKTVLETATAAKAPPCALPVRAVLEQDRAPLTIFWSA